MSAGVYLRSFISRSVRSFSRPITLDLYGQTRLFRCFPPRFQGNLQSSASQENLYGGHSRFIAEAKRGEKWADGVDNSRKGGEEGTGEEVEDLPDGMGRLSPTSSHLFKLIVPIPTPDQSKPPLTVFLLHPSQPLSHVSRLIQASLPPDTPTNTSIAFRSVPHSPSSKVVQWSDSTDIGDFVKEAAQDREFAITVSQPSNVSKSNHSEPKPKPEEPETSIRILVPSFRSRTRFFRHRLRTISTELSKLEKIKRECDHIAHRSARRLALGGFGMLLVYFGAVARLTFWDFGWEIMEPVTYLSGLTWIICGYMWFLYQGREVSYSSLLKQSVSTRRAKLYESKGLDVDLWADLVTEEKQLRKEIYKIADDYNVKWDGTPEGSFTVLNSTSGSQPKPQPKQGKGKEEDRGKGEEGEMTPEERLEKQKKRDEKAEIERGDGKREEKEEK
ncbi:hypothetical protein FRC08_007558 [Ceratobasidium sp. 394]|nr:hypothetical protein FRC08_007558 [Ceratobasidium sp. 394]KAG9098500.1 hypothetical protein FS749_003673 [Ceratobasidium sp. UAMH 11750]